MVILSFYCNQEHIIVKNSPFFLRDSGAGTATDVRDIQMLSVGKTVMLFVSFMTPHIKWSRSKKNKHTTRTTNMRNYPRESVSSLINRFRDAGLVCHTKFQELKSNHCYLLDFFRIPFRGALLFLLAGASSKRLLWSACVSKLSFLACVRSFSNLSRALKCCACKYKLCSIAKRSLLSNSSTRLLSSTGEGACLVWAE